MNIIETESLSLHYGQTLALKNLTMSIPEGSVVAYLGPNGAGKTTTIKILMNLLRATSGTARVLDVDSGQLGRHQLNRIGYVSENQHLPDWMTVQQLLNFCRPLYPTWSEAFAERMLQQFDLPLDRKIRTLSRGMQMKASLLSSIAYYPRLLILDEPFSGLDPLVRDEFIEGILELTETEQWTILISSHDIDEVERLADQVMIIDKGELRISESVEKLQARFRSVEVRIEGPAIPPYPRPADWLNLEVSGSRVRFVHSAYLAEQSEAEIILRFGPSAILHVEPLSMKEIYLALAKQNRIAL